MLGNCLFAALSDQLYGDESHHMEIRARVVEFMRLNGAYFKPFLPVNVGGGERRNSRRSTAGRYAATYDLHEPTEAEINQQYELKLQNLAQPNEYGDHLAILAFSGQYGVTVKVHQAKTACEEVSAAGLALEGATEAASDPLVAHIAYHVGCTIGDARSNINSKPVPRALFLRTPYRRSTPGLDDDCNFSHGKWEGKAKGGSAARVGRRRCSPSLTIRLLATRAECKHQLSI